GFGYVKNLQARKQATIQINLLQLALESYKADTGEYPLHAVANGKNGTAEIFDELFPANASDKPYLAELDPDNDSQGWLQGATGRSLKIYDPWGTEYFYRTNDPSNPNRSFAANPDFDLWSAGPD